MTRPFHLPTCRCAGTGQHEGGLCPGNDGQPITDQEWADWRQRNYRAGYRPPPRSTVDGHLAAARRHLRGGHDA